MFFFSSNVESSIDRVKLSTVVVHSPSSLLVIFLGFTQKTEIRIKTGTGELSFTNVF